MLIPVFFTLSLAFQSQVLLSGDPMEVMDRTTRTYAQQEASERDTDKRLDFFLERNFELKFNGVAKALEDFGKSWNQAHAIDPDKARKLNKAWRALERADPWFDTSLDDPGKVGSAKP